MQQFLLYSAEYEYCNLGHNHEIKPAIYRVPSKEETINAQTYIKYSCDEASVTRYCWNGLVVE